ncbi:MAG: hypothetical protein NZ988_03790 [Thaumarchaeota archaeon]|nr:hypothetical protein [Candidatus Calditenuaceae archaeon]MDW8187152.1 hypothetical protein [Nitrososphaerota archaeon]
MARRIAVVVLLVGFLLAFGLTRTGLSQSALEVNREVRVGLQGLVTVHDEIRVSGHPELTVTLHNPDKLLDYVVEGGNIVTTRVDGDSLLVTIKPNADKVYVRSAYTGMVNENADGTYVLSLRGVPVLWRLEHSTNVTYLLPNDAEDVRAPSEHTVRGRAVVKYYARSLELNERTSIRFSSGSMILVTVERSQLTVDPSSGTASLLIRLRNDGLSSFDYLRVRIPSPNSVKVLRVGDQMGALRYNYDESGGELLVYFTPERYSLSSGWRYEFSVILQSNPGVFTRLESGVLRVLNFLPVESRIESFSIRVILPQGLELESMDSRVTQYFMDERGRYVVELSPKVLYLSQGYIDLNLRGQPQQPVQLYVLLTGVLVLVASVVVSVIRTSARPKPRVTEAERASLERLRGRVAEVFAELTRVEELLREPSRPGYQSLQESVRKIRRLSDSLSQEARPVLQRGGEVSRAASMAQKSLQEINESLRAISNAYTSYVRGEITKTAMERMVSPVLREIKKSSFSLKEFEMVLSELLG